MKSPSPFGTLAAAARTGGLALFLFTFSGPAWASEPVVCFTPGGQCTGLIVDEIAGARRSIDVQAYSFTSPEILQALVDAHGRGVAVRVIVDKSQKTERYSGLTFVRNAGVPVWIDARVAIAHNKVMILDRETVITGSFNFTRSAQERNAENVLVLKDPELAARYEANWLARQRVSTRVP